MKSSLSPEPTRLDELTGVTDLSSFTSCNIAFSLLYINIKLIILKIFLLPLRLSSVTESLDNYSTRIRSFYKFVLFHSYVFKLRFLSAYFFTSYRVVFYPYAQPLIKYLVSFFYLTLQTIYTMFSYTKYPLKLNNVISYTD